MRYRILSIALLAGITLLGTSCKKWLDINENPNIAQDVPVGPLLSSAEINLGSAYAVDFQINGAFWAQHWTQASSSSQYKVLEQYQPNSADYDREWQILYANALKDLDVVEDKATVANQRDYIAVSQIMKAYLIQLVTDAWGDVPYSEALQGEAGTFNPKYDAQQTIYTSLDGMLDNARTLIDALSAEGIHTLGETSADYHGDFIFGGDLDLWRKFANTLQLKAGLRLSQRSPGDAQARVAKAFAAAATGPGFLEAGENAAIVYSSTALNQNPLYAEIIGLGATQNIVASATVVDSMNANNDYRAYGLFTFLSNGLVVGIPQGAYNLPSSTPVSIPTAYTGARAQDDASATAIVRFMSDYESYFLQAEAVARGWASGSGSDEDLFYEGLAASFAALDASIETESGLTGGYEAYVNGDASDSTNIIPPAYWGQYPNGETPDTKIRHIITQKWFAFTGTQGFEAWTEWRRTGYPDFFTVSANSIIGANFPNSFLYPDIERSRNSSFPGQRIVTDKVWWDAN